MHISSDQDERLWGARVSTEWYQSGIDCPKWAKSSQRDSWKKGGLILWDQEARQITRLSATQALHFLEQLRTTDGWQRHDIVVGEPATTLFLDDPEREPEPSLINEMTLSPERTQEVLELLERHEQALQRLAEAEKEDRQRRLGKVYAILLGLAERKTKEEQVDEAQDEG